VLLFIITDKTNTVITSDGDMPARSDRDMPASCLIHLLVALSTKTYVVSKHGSSTKAFAFGVHAILFHMAKLHKINFVQKEALYAFKKQINVFKTEYQLYKQHDQEKDGRELGKRLGNILAYISIWFNDPLTDLREILEAEYRADLRELLEAEHRLNRAWSDIGPRVAHAGPNIRPRVARDFSPVVHILASVYIGLQGKPRGYPFSDEERNAIVKAGRESEVLAASAPDNTQIRGTDPALYRLGPN